MAYVDLATKEIRGCDKNTLTYYHEEGHLAFDKNSRGMLIRSLQSLSLRFLIGVMALTIISPYPIMKTILIFVFLTNIFSEIYEEFWAWRYAQTKRDIYEYNNKRK